MANSRGFHLHQHLTFPSRLHFLSCLGCSRGAIRKQFFKMASTVWQEQQRVKNGTTPSEFVTWKAAHYKLGPWVAVGLYANWPAHCLLPYHSQFPLFESSHSVTVIGNK